MIRSANPTVSEIIELWRSVFGEPPSILIEPAQMMALLRAHALSDACPACPGALEMRV